MSDAQAHGRRVPFLKSKLSRKIDEIDFATQFAL